MRSTNSLPLFIFVLFTACSSGNSHKNEPEDSGTDRSTFIMDTHSHAEPQKAVITHLDLRITVDLDAKRISGKASYAISAKNAERIVFDTDGLYIEGVTDGAGSELTYAFGDSSFLGKALNVTLPKGTDEITIAYHTVNDAKALQWLSAGQTADKEHPFLFTQGQAILTRSWIPIQDSPGIRFTYTAEVKVPEGLMAVMSATNPQAVSVDGVYRFQMDQPIPAYLMALAVGDFVFEPIGERTGVYAEESLVKKAAWEFGDMERMLEAAEGLYGPYRWGRYDVIVLPPSFPFGGMENPRITFATPTIIAGDRSLTSLIAHELAHSWSGNLVTNATWNDFWLNEGFTVYFENRITEAIYGKEFALMGAVLGRQDLYGTIGQLEKQKHLEDTHLRLHLEGRDPDEGMTDIAYEKGYAFLRLLEEKVGREKFDAFLRDYFDHYAFQSMTTDRFLDHLEANLLEPNKVQVDIAAWVDGPGLPKDAPIPVSDRFVKVEKEIAKWQAGTPATNLSSQDWSTYEWMHFLRHLPREMTADQMNELDATFHFTQSGNAEVLAAWLEQCIRNDHVAAYESLDRFLNTVGRRKFLEPLYTALLETEKGRIMAQTIYASARPGYHSVAVRTMDEMLKWNDNKPPASF